jgi:hypothetical protein
MKLLLFPLLFLLFSCSAPEPLVKKTAGIPEAGRPPLPPRKAVPELRIADYKNRANGAALAPWLQAYLRNGIAGAESLEAYRGAYLFVASVHSHSLAVINQWVGNFSPDQDFSRLAAERIRARLERGISGFPEDVYGQNYQQAVRAVYRTVFWGARKENDSWILGTSPAVSGDTPSSPPLYRGFILVSIPRDSLEIQVNELLSELPGSGKKGELARDQDDAFEEVKEKFFERF